MNTRSRRNHDPRSTPHYTDRAIHRIRVTASESMRYNLFSLRCEILWSAMKIIRVINIRQNGQNMMKGRGYDLHNVNNINKIITLEKSKSNLMMGDLGSSQESDQVKLNSADTSDTLDTVRNDTATASNNLMLSQPHPYNTFGSVLTSSNSHPYNSFGSVLTGSSSSLNDSHRLSLSCFWSSELCLAVADGLTIRTLKVTNYYYNDCNHS